VASRSTTIDPRAIYDFEDGTTQSWAPRWGTVTATNELGVAASGAHGLAVTVPRAGYAAVGADTGLARVTPGATVSYRIWAPTGVNVGVSPIVYDSNWHVTVLASQTLAAGWNRVTFRVPPTLAGVRVLGLQVDDGSGWTASLNLDDVTVATVHADFEDGTTDGWATRWGALTTARATGTAFTGTHGLALTVAGAGHPAAGTDQITGLTPGMTVIGHLWAPTGVNVAVSPVVYDANWNVTVLASQTVRAGWNTISFDVPTSMNGLRIVGLQVNDGSGWTGTITVDTVAW
jgi:hypothetical protein